MTPQAPKYFDLCDRASPSALRLDVLRELRETMAVLMEWRKELHATTTILIPTVRLIDLDSALFALADACHAWAMMEGAASMSLDDDTSCDEVEVDDTKTLRCENIKLRNERDSLRSVLDKSPCLQPGARIVCGCCGFPFGDVVDGLLDNTWPCPVCHTESNRLEVTVRRLAGGNPNG